MTRTVLTGAPCSGKTAVSAALAAAFPNLVVIPEAATQVYSSDGSRWDLLDLPGQKDRQRRIYQLQITQEAAAAARHPGQDLLLDRGTLDGAAYWPDGPDTYWQEMGTTRHAELARYDRVILMESSAALGVYAPESNACRFEDAPGALANGRLLTRLWAGHPHLITVPAFPTLQDKIAAVIQILHPE